MLHWFPLGMHFAWLLLKHDPGWLSLLNHEEGPRLAHGFIYFVVTLKYFVSWGGSSRL